MKVLFEFDDNKFRNETRAMPLKLVRLFIPDGTEVYERKTSWRTKEESHHVYNLNPTEVGGLRLQFISDELYGMGKLKGRPQED
jgi:hypothetical protein